MRLFLVKFSNKYPEQIEGKYYVGGDVGNPYYGDVQEGDYVFPAYEGKILGLWKAKGFGPLKRGLISETAMFFDEINHYDNVLVIDNFCMYKYFVHDLNLLNKAVKTIKNLGFIPIAQHEGCPHPEDIDFIQGTINMFFGLSNDFSIDEGDILVKLSNDSQYEIETILRMVNSKLVEYKELYKLYLDKNDEYYTLKKLREFAILDSAPKKKNYLETLIYELDQNGVMRVNNPISLYDSVLVGRKKSHKSKNKNVKKYDIDDLYDDSYEEYAELLKYNPNIILYGPPGTGKTYATDKIINSYEKLYNNNGTVRAAKEENRVHTITFHQSYSYEEFIEGIRPSLDSETIGYNLEDGIFKTIAKAAFKEILREDTNEYIDLIKSNSEVWKISLGRVFQTDLYQDCLSNNYIGINWLKEHDLVDMDKEEIESLLMKEDRSEKPTNDVNTVFAFTNDMNIGDIVFVYGAKYEVRMIGIITGDYEYSVEYKFKHTRKVNWIKDLNYPINIAEVNGHKALTMKTIYKLNRVNINDAISLIKDNHEQSKFSVEDKRKPYYLIIDEINRGNIAKIFGELISLIESDKRDTMKVTLPYSKEKFTVPSNLLIIGTMNTADRSIASIDTALRRRFAFAEIAPDSSIITKNGNSIINSSVDITKLLNHMNDKILEVIDKDHRIGHSYFMQIEFLKDLYQIWYYNIIPLLNEYFYNDVNSIKEVIGSSFFDENGNVVKLSMEHETGKKSKFEKSLIKIYE